MRLFILLLLFAGTEAMASQADVRRMVDQLPGMQSPPAQPRDVPVAPPLDEERQANRPFMSPEFLQHWRRLMREYEGRPAPYGNQNLKGPFIPDQPPLETVPYEDPWTGPTLAPDSPEGRYRRNKRY